MMWVFLLYSCSKWCLWILRLQSQRVPWPKDGRLNRLLYMDCSYPCLFTLCSETGYGAEDGFPSSVSTSTWGMATSTLLDLLLCTWWAGLPLLRGLSCLVRESGNMVKMDP